MDARISKQENPMIASPDKSGLTGIRIDNAQIIVLILSLLGLPVPLPVVHLPSNQTTQGRVLTGKCKHFPISELKYYKAVRRIWSRSRLANECLAMDLPICSPWRLPLWVCRRVHALTCKPQHSAAWPGVMLACPLTFSTWVQHTLVAHQAAVSARWARQP